MSAVRFVAVFIVIGIALLCVVQALGLLFPTVRVADRVLSVLLAVAAVQAYEVAYRLGAP